MNIKKTAITMILVPSIVITGLYGCAKSDSTVAQEVTTNPISQSYEQAKANGYTGTEQEWEKLLALYNTNPQAAKEEASQFGLSEVLLASVAGAALGALLGSQVQQNSMKREEEKRRANTGYVNTNTAATANRSSYSSTTGSKPATSSVSLAKAPSTTSVARGGFGGAVSSGG